MNTGERPFPHFRIIKANSFRGFEAFENNNNNPSSRNNNNNNPLSPLLLPPPGGNAGRLNPNIAVLINTLTGANLGVNYVERESNHIKLTEFRGTEAENPNEWLE